jgi:hypothetical protein
MEIWIFCRASLVGVLISFLFLRNNLTLAQTTIPDSSVKSFRLFEEEKPVEITLRFDLSTYFRTRPKEDYLKANITFNLSKTDSISKNIRLRTRGYFRNHYCIFPPIELNFKKADFGYKDLNKISKLKLVVQCGSGKDKEEYVLREYLTYKLFNVLTDTSFRVRLLTVNYIDTEKKRKPFKQNGFFIEPVDMITSRTKSFQVKSKTLTQKSIVPFIMDRVAIFNYMIGNYDWSVPGQHNILILNFPGIDPYGRAIAIPHDFDWTGVVNATYAVPAEEVGTENVRERIFTGVCRRKEVFQQDLELFLRKKQEFYKVINDFPYLSQRSKKDITRYLDEFFDQLEGKGDLILNNLLNSCKIIQN